MQHYKRSSRRPPSTVAPKIDDSSLVRKARNLPMFGTGLEITIPLHLLPAYMELYGLEVLGPKQIAWLRERGVRKKDGMLYVRRVPKEKIT